MHFLTRSLIHCEELFQVCHHNFPPSLYPDAAKVDATRVHSFSASVMNAVRSVEHVRFKELLPLGNLCEEFARYKAMLAAL
jgi:hypothetical protein